MKKPLLITQKWFFYRITYSCYYLSKNTLYKSQAIIARAIEANQNNYN